MNIPCPCKDCPERFIACSDHCPKDDRGEYGYKAWKAEMAELKKAMKTQNSIAYTAAKRRAKWAYIKRDYSGATKKFSS
jgi:hypothetical protein